MHSGVHSTQSTPSVGCKGTPTSPKQRRANRGQQSVQSVLQWANSMSIIRTGGSASSPSSVPESGTNGNSVDSVTTQLNAETISNIHDYQRHLNVGCGRLEAKFQQMIDTHNMSGVEMKGPRDREGSKCDHYTSLAQTAHEVGQHLGDTTLGKVLDIYSKAQNNISVSKTLFDMTTQQNVLSPLHEVITSDQKLLEHLEKQSKRTSKLQEEVIDLHTVLAKKEKASEKGKLRNNSDEAERVRRDLEDAQERLGSHQYQYTSEVLEVSAGRDVHIGEIFLKLTENHIRYHEECLEQLHMSLASLQDLLFQSSMHAAFGCPLDVYCEVNNAEVSPVIQSCCKYLMTHISTESGIFRLTGPKTQTRRLRANFNMGIHDCSEFSPHTITSVLKQYLRDLPDPLMTLQMQPAWQMLGGMSQQRTQERNKLIKENLSKLPAINYTNLRYLVVFLNYASTFQDVTKMGAGNLALVIGPNLQDSDISSGGNNGAFANTQNMCKILSELISNCEHYFPEGAELPREPEEGDLFETVGSLPSAVHIISERQVRNKERVLKPPVCLMDTVQKRSAGNVESNAKSSRNTRHESIDEMNADDGSYNLGSTEVWSSGTPGSWKSGPSSTRGREANKLLRKKNSKGAIFYHDWTPPSPPDQMESGALSETSHTSASFSLPSSVTESDSTSITSNSSSNGGIGSGGGSTSSYGSAASKNRRLVRTLSWKQRRNARIANSTTTANSVTSNMSK